MADNDSLPEFPDEVPVADAVEQIRPVVEPGDEMTPGADAAPLETDASDWQEQREEIDPFDEDEFR